MSSDQPRASNRSWKTGEPGSQSQADIGPRWRSERELALARKQRRRARRRARIAILLLAFGLFCGLLVWVSLWLRPAKDTGLILVGASYQDNLAVPHNVYGWQGLKELADFARTIKPSSTWDAAGQLQLGAEPREILYADDWDQGLDRIPGKTILLVLGMNAGADAKGAYLLPHRALLPPETDAPAEKSFLRLEAVLKRLKELPSKKNIVLVLDAGPLAAHWPLGMLQNDFARELAKLEPVISGIPNLLVLSSAAADQHSWASEELGKTVFSHFLLEGLKGAADTEPRDGRITAHELFKYVARNVQQWALANRDAAQTPVIYPSGSEGVARARSIHLTMAQPYTSPNLAGLAPFAPPSELVDAWNEYKRLDEGSPHPASCTPHLWRRYQEGLLRYEELVRAGSKDGAALLASQLRNLQQDILAGQKLDLGSDKNTLAMPAARGLLLSRHEAWRKTLQQLWETPAMDLPAKWAQAQKQAAAGDGADFPPAVLLRLKLTEMLVELAAQDPINNLDKAYRLLQVLDDPLAPRPEEAHFLAMLHRDMPRLSARIETKATKEATLESPPALPADLLTQALRVRLRAEQASLGLHDPAKPGPFPGGNYPFAEQVSPWIREMISRADGDRRLGQDLLFASDPASWGKSAGLLARADSLYQQAQDIAVRVRQSLAVRDQVAPLLPFYAHWLARRPAKDSGDSLAMFDRVERLCLETHKLARMLEEPKSTVADAKFRGAADDIRQQAQLVQSSFKTVTSWARIYRQNLDEVDLPARWKEIDDALAVPFGAAHARTELLTKKNRIALRLLKKAPPSQHVFEEQASKSAQRQGRMALAVLGKRWFDEADAELESYEGVRHRLESRRVEDLAAAGEQIGQRWQRLPDAIGRILQDCRKGSASQAGTAFLKADRLTRLLDAGQTLYLDKTSNPAALRRQLLVEDLLLAQTDRAFQDHWFDLDPAKEPYYRRVAQLYLADAGRLPSFPFAQPDARLEAWKDKLKQPGELRLTLSAAPGLQPLNGSETAADVPAILEMTSEREFPLKFRLASPSAGGVPDGYPVLWAEAGPGLEIIRSTPGAAKEEDSRRLAQEIKTGGDLLLPLTLASPMLNQAEEKTPAGPQATESHVTMRGLYRGQVIELKTRIDLHPLARTVVTSHPLPRRAGVAVRAARSVHQQFGASNGAIAIVLDCSGSMRPPGTDAFGKDTKYVEATNAVRHVLTKIPKGTQVSLWAFGQAGKEEKGVAIAENTIEQIQPPVIWDPEDGKQLNALMARVEYPALEPWNESPIVRTMLLAKQDLQRVAGFKTLLVITDGMDNRFAQDAEFNREKKDIPNVLRDNFRDVVVNVVGFKVVSKEMEQARKQFQVVAELPLPGKFYEVAESRLLVATLDKVMRQKLSYWVDSEDNLPVPGMPDAGLDVSRAGGNDQWFPRGPGSYKVRVLTNRRLTQNILLNRGELLLLDLVPSELAGAPPGQLDFERVLFSREHGNAAFKEKGAWLLAALENKRVADRGLQMLMTLEKKSDRLASTLQQIKPFQTWIEVAKPGDDKATLPQRWHYQPGYPAPAWSIDMPFWPASPDTGTPVRPRLNVWFNPDQEPPASATLERGHDFVFLPDIVNKSVTVNAGTVLIESVRVEEHLVETRPALGGRPAKRAKKPCLVVRARHAQGNPVWVRVRGLNPTGHEHRFYSQAGKYTGIFWSVTSDQAALELKSIEVISLAAFKSDAEQRRFKIELDNMPVPEADVVRPVPPIDLFEAPPSILPGADVVLPAPRPTKK